MDPDKLSSFMSVTSASADRARAYLEATHGDLEAAVAMFYAAGEEGEDSPARHVPAAAVAAAAGPPEAPSRNPTTAPAAAAARPAAGAPQSRFVTMDALRARRSGGHGHSHGGGGGSSGSEEDDDDEGAQAFYVGGSERGGGGQQVLGPPGSKRPDAGRIATSLFASARKHGATEVSPGEEDAADARAGGFAAFGGRGRRLDQVAPTEAAAVAEGPQHRPAGRDEPARAAPVCRVLKLWSNGVSIDDGPLRPFEAPDTRELLRAVAQGHVPEELRADARGARVDLQLEDHRDVEYSAAGAAGRGGGAFRAFAGSGLVLGSPVPPAIGTAPAAAVVAQAAAASAAAAPAGGATAVPVDSGQPTTSLNVRLPSGGRPLSVTLNHRHTVADLRRYLRAERPELSTASFGLFTTFPTAEIADEAQSLADAGLINAAVLVRIK